MTKSENHIGRTTYFGPFAKKKKKWYWCYKSLTARADFLCIVEGEHLSKKYGLQASEFFFCVENVVFRF